MDFYEDSVERNKVLHDIFGESTLDDNQMYVAIRLCILHVFGKHADKLSDYNLETCDYVPIMKFLRLMYAEFENKKIYGSGSAISFNKCSCNNERLVNL